MAKNKKTKRSGGAKGRNVFEELMSGVKAMREHRDGRLKLRTHRVGARALRDRGQP